MISRSVSSIMDDNFTACHRETCFSAHFGVFINWPHCKGLFYLFAMVLMFLMRSMDR